MMWGVLGKALLVLFCIDDSRRACSIELDDVLEVWERLWHYLCSETLDQRQQAIRKKAANVPVPRRRHDASRLMS